jgi:hypothetical protein
LLILKRAIDGKPRSACYLKPRSTNRRMDSSAVRAQCALLGAMVERFGDTDVERRSMSRNRGGRCWG